jgi:hypothetical protein
MRPSWLDAGLVRHFLITVTYFRPQGIHGLEARAAIVGQRGTGFQPVTETCSTQLPRQNARPYLLNRVLRARLPACIGPASGLAVDQDLTAEGNAFTANAGAANRFPPAAERTFLPGALHSQTQRVSGTRVGT